LKSFLKLPHLLIGICEITIPSQKLTRAAARGITMKS
jgi:hypothetical protein